MDIFFLCVLVMEFEVKVQGDLSVTCEIFMRKFLLLALNGFLKIYHFSIIFMLLSTLAIEVIKIPLLIPSLSLSVITHYILPTSHIRCPVLSSQTFFSFSLNSLPTNLTYDFDLQEDISDQFPIFLSQRFSLFFPRFSPYSVICVSLPSSINSLLTRYSLFYSSFVSKKLSPPSSTNPSTMFSTYL
ncbi:hypothetical protein ACOSQ3_003530 [Xanthoceras sorbifolium]